MWTASSWDQDDPFPPRVSESADSKQEESDGGDRRRGTQARVTLESPVTCGKQASRSDRSLVDTFSGLQIYDPAAVERLLSSVSGTLNAPTNQLRKASMPRDGTPGSGKTPGLNPQSTNGLTSVSSPLITWTGTARLTSSPVMSGAGW